MKRSHVRYSLVFTFFSIAFSYIFWQNYASAANNQELAKAEDLKIYCEQVRNDDTINPIIKERVLKALARKLQLTEEKKEEADLSADDSYQRYLSDSRLLGDVKYEPKDLEKIGTDYAIVKAYRPYLRAEAAKAFNQLAQAFYEKFNRKLYVVSAYRSYNDQLNLVNNGCDFERCAKVGGSEHQLGLAVDIHISNGQGGYRAMGAEFFDWLKENAYLYGFHNTYSKGYHVDGKMVENWHRRYVGEDFAKVLYERGITIGEYTKS